MAHVVLFPFPALGHHKPMLMIAELLCHNGLHVTFLTIDHNQHQTVKSATHLNGGEFHQRLRFMSLSEEGSVKEKPRTLAQLGELMMTMDTTYYKQKLKEFMVSLTKEDAKDGWPRPTCVISDGMLTFAVEVAEELGLQVFVHQVYSAAAAWSFINTSKLIDLGEVPFTEDSMDTIVTCIPGMETFRRRDLPCTFKQEPDNPSLRFFKHQTKTMARASGLLLNTFKELEEPIVEHLGSIFSEVYTIGPLNDFVRVARMKNDSHLPNFGTLREENRECLTWLDSQQPKSVLYVSFGSLVTITHEKLQEFWYGLVNSGKCFLWVIRSDMIDGEKHEVPPELVSATKERGFIVDWAPQEEILVHKSVGGFLTHVGWNSTIESISAGVGMICWPQFGDHLVNRRCVSEIWKVGIDMNDVCDRLTVEMTVKDIMEDKREDIRNAVAKFSRFAQQSVREGGSSDKCLKRLIEDIKANELSCNNSSQSL